MEESAQTDLGKEQNEEIDIYEDVCDFDLGDEIEKLKNENKKLENQIHNLNENITSLNNTVADLEETRNNLSQNISSLFLTAKTEIERKNRTIEELRLQVDTNHTNKCNSDYTKRKDRESGSSESGKTKRCKYDNAEKNCVSDTESKASDKQEYTSKNSSDRHTSKASDKQESTSKNSSDRHTSKASDKQESTSKNSSDRHRLKASDKQESTSKNSIDRHTSKASDKQETTSKISSDRHTSKASDKQESTSKLSSDRHTNSNSNRHTEDDNKHRSRSQYPTERVYSERYDIRSKYSNERYNDDGYGSRNRYTKKYNSCEDDGYSSRSRYSYDRYPEVEYREDPRVRYSNDRYYNRSNYYFNNDRYSAYERERMDYMWDSRSNIGDGPTYDRESCRSEVEDASKCINLKSLNQTDSNDFRNEERRSPDRTQHLQSSSEITDYASWRKRREAVIETTKNTVGSEEGNVEQRRSITPETSWLLEYEETLIETKNIEIEAEEQSSATSKPLLGENETPKVKPAKKRLKMLEDMEKKIKWNKSQTGNVFDSGEHSSTCAGKSKSTLTRSTNDDSDKYSTASIRSSRSDKSSTPIKSKASSKRTDELRTKLNEKTNQTKGKISRLIPKKLVRLERCQDTEKSVISPQKKQKATVEKVKDISITKQNTKNSSDILDEDRRQIPKKSSPKPAMTCREEPEKGTQKNEEGKIKDKENDERVFSGIERKELLSKDRMQIDKVGKTAISSENNSKRKTEDQESKRDNEKVTVGKNEHKKDEKQSDFDENADKQGEIKTEKEIQAKDKECMVKCTRDGSNPHLKERIISEQVVEVGRKVETDKIQPSKSDKKNKDKPKYSKSVSETTKTKNEENTSDTLTNDCKVVNCETSNLEESGKPSKHSTKQPEQDVTREQVVKDGVNENNKDTIATCAAEKDNKINYSEKQTDQLVQKDKPVKNDEAQLASQIKRDEVATNIERQSENNSIGLKRKRRQSTYADQNETFHSEQHSENDRKSSGIELKQSTCVDDNKRTGPEHQSESRGKSSSYVLQRNQREPSFQERDGDNTHIEHQLQDCSKSFSIDQNADMTRPERQSENSDKSSSFEVKLKRRQSTFEERHDIHTENQSEAVGKSSSIEFKPKYQSTNVEQDVNISHHEHKSKNDGKSSSFELKLKQGQSTFVERDESITHAENQSESDEKPSALDLTSKKSQSTKAGQADNVSHFENDLKSSSFVLNIKRRQSTFQEQDDIYTLPENRSESIGTSSEIGFLPKQGQSRNIEQDDMIHEHHSESNGKSSNFETKLKRKQSSFEERADTNTHTEKQSDEIGKLSGMEFEPKGKQSTDVEKDDNTTNCQHQFGNNDQPSSFEFKRKRRKSTFEVRNDPNTHIQNEPEYVDKSSNMELEQKISTNLDQNQSATRPEHQIERNDKSSCVELKGKSPLKQQDGNNTYTEHQSEEIEKSSSNPIKRKRRQSTYVEQDDSITENKGRKSNSAKKLVNEIDERERPAETVAKQNLLSKHILKSPNQITQRMTRSRLKNLEEESKIIEKPQNNDLKKLMETVPVVKEVALEPGEQRLRVNEVRRRIKFLSQETVSKQTEKKTENIQGHTTTKDEPTNPKKDSKCSDSTLFSNENSSDTSSDSLDLEDSGKASDSTEKNKRRTCKSKTKRPSTESSSSSSSSDDDHRDVKNKNISTSSSSDSEIIDTSSDGLLSTFKTTHKLIEINNVEKESIVKIKSIGSSDSSISDDGTIISTKRMSTEKRIDNLIKSCIEKYTSADRNNEPEKCTTLTIAENTEDKLTHENVTSKVTESKTKIDVTVTTATSKSATTVREEKSVAIHSKSVTNFDKASAGSDVYNNPGNTRPLTRRRITPIPVKDAEPHCSFQNVLEKPRQPETFPATTAVGISPLHLTHDGEIPVLHLDDNHINNLPTEVNINDKNIMTLLESMNISNIDCDIPKFKSGENTVNSVLNVSSGNDSGLTFENIIQKVASPPTKIKNVDTSVKNIVSCSTLDNESVSTNRTASSVVDSSAQPKTTSTPFQRKRRRCRLVIIG